MTGRSRTPSPTRIVHSTPALRKVSTKKPFDVAVAPVEEVKADMARETQGYWIGPCPTEHFFDSMNAPSSDDDSSPAQPDIPATYFKEMNVTCEKDIYKAIVVLANGEGDHPPLLPEHTLVDTSNHSDPNAELGAKIRTDLGHYWNGVVSKKHPTLLDLMLIAYEVKKSHNEDIVNDTMECTISCPHDCECPYEITNPTATRIRGQLANYATQICRRQHRTHFYMVFIFHPFVRFIRWDRAGAIVTRRVNYVEDCTPLVRFLYLFGRLDRAGQGLDPTTRPASQAEAKKAKRYLKRWEPKLERTVFKMDVPATNGAMRQFLVWGSVADPESPFGRATRGYPAVEVVDGVVSAEPVFLKEQWRSVEVSPEVETLKELKSRSVSHVPTLICGGDLPGQETKSHLISDPTWRVGHKHIDKRIHTRFVVAEVGRPLKQFKSSKVMLGVIYDAFQAHKDAVERCKILHRDISGSNILILDNNTGILSDWDLARRKSDIRRGPRMHERSGTWPFMSSALLQTPRKEHTTRDDLESFFWVVLYYALRYVPHSLNSSVEATMKKIFDDYCYEARGNTARGGFPKMAVITGGSFIGSAGRPRLTFTNCHPLTDFVFHAVALLREWDAGYDHTVDGFDDYEEYTPIAHEDMEAVWITALESHSWPRDDGAVDQVELARQLSFKVPNEPLERTNTKRQDPPEPKEEDEQEESLRGAKRRKT